MLGEGAQQVGVASLQRTHEGVRQGGASEARAEPVWAGGIRIGGQRVDLPVHAGQEVPSEQPEQQLVLGLPVQVGSALADVGPLGDLGDGQPFDPALEHQLAGRGEDPGRGA